MARTHVVFYKDVDGTVPVLNWLDGLLKKGERQGWAKCRERIRRLAEFGYELRRPHADFLRDGIYELRAKHGRVNYRILYFFHGRNLAVLAHGLTKKKEVPDVEIDRAIRRKQAFERNPEEHVYQEDSVNGKDERRSEDPGPEDRP